MTDLFILIEMHPAIGLAILFSFFLLIGSFLNVVIYRLPIMMFARYEQEHQDYMQHQHHTLTLPPATSPPSFNLAWPASHCPQCKHALRPWHNIPLLSFIFQKGKCAFCGQAISWQYPSIELLTAVTSLMGMTMLGFTLQGACFLVFTYFLICLSIIDLHHYLLPDELTLSLLWFGLLLSTTSVFCSSHDAIIGAAIGYGLFSAIQLIFGLFTGKIGLGQGDHKLFAALAAFTGWQLLPILLLIAAGLGLLFAGVRLAQGKSIHNYPIPFGPALALSGWVCLLAHDQLLMLYL